jgi:hypothetical protein
MAGDKIVMPANTWMMIHNPWTVSMGDAEQLRKDADLLDRMKVQLIGAYRRHSNKTEAELARLLDDETWLTAAEAKDLGLCHEVIGEIAAAASVNGSPFAKVPESAKVWAKKKEGENETGKAPVNPEPATGGKDGGAQGLPVEIKARIDAAWQEGHDAGRESRAAEVRAELSAKMAEASASYEENVKTMAAAIDSAAKKANAQAAEVAKLNAALEKASAKLQALAGGLVFDAAEESASHNSDNASEVFWARVGVLVAQGKTQEEAIVSVRRQSPDLHRDMVEAANKNSKK